MRIIPLSLFLIGISLLALACSDKTKTLESVGVSGFRTIITVDAETELKNGPAKVLDASGKLIEEANYVDDKLDGIRVLYDESGDTTTIETYKAGQFDGYFKSFHSGGQKLKLIGLYVNNVMTGQWKKYYTNGQLQEVVTFANNEENGSFREWFEDGTLAAEGNYRNGDNEHGRLRIYNTNGSLNRVMNCDMGVCQAIWRDSFPTPPPARELSDFE